jgi:hypothetical protein
MVRTPMIRFILVSTGMSRAFSEAVDDILASVVVISNYKRYTVQGIWYLDILYRFLGSEIAKSKFKIDI